MKQEGKWEQGAAVILLIVLLAWVAYAEELNQTINEITQPEPTPSPKPNPEPLPPTPEPLPTDDEKPVPIPLPEPSPEPVPPSPIPQIDVASPLEGEEIHGILIIIPKFNYPKEISRAWIEIQGENYSFEQELERNKHFIGEWDSTLAQNGEFRLLVNGCIEKECTQKTINFFVKNKIEPIPVPEPTDDENQTDENLPLPPIEQKFTIIPSNVLSLMSVFNLNGEEVASSSEKIELHKGTYNAKFSFIQSALHGMTIEKFDVQKDFTFVEVKEDFEIEKSIIGLDENSSILKTIALKFGTNFFEGKVLFNYLQDSTALFECNEFDFENNSCITKWIKTHSLNPVQQLNEIQIDSKPKAFVFASLPPIVARMDKRLIIEKLHESFAANQAAEFRIIFEDEKGKGHKPKKIEIALVDPIGNIIPLNNIFASLQKEVSEGEYFVSIPPKRSFRPGNYQIQVTANDENFSYSENSSFTWGVIAINTRKSIYKPQETAEFEIVVLDELSFGVCDAEMEIILNIVSPDGNAIQLSKSNGEIQQLPECGVFKAKMVVEKEGTYKMSAFASFRGIQNQIESDFLVKQNYEYDIIRNTQTKIDPKGTPEFVEIIIDSFGKQKQIQIVEKVPRDFEIFNTDAEIAEDGEIKTITWNKKISEPITLSYNYQVPQIYPWLYYIGQIEISETNAPIKEKEKIIEIPTDNNSVDLPQETDINSLDSNNLELQKLIEKAKTNKIILNRFNKLKSKFVSKQSVKEIAKIFFDEIDNANSEPEIFKEARPWMIAVDANPTSNFFFRNDTEFNAVEPRPNASYTANGAWDTNSSVLHKWGSFGMMDVVSISIGQTRTNSSFSSNSSDINIQIASFISPPLINQTINSGTWTGKGWCKESADNDNLSATYSLYVWDRNDSFKGEIFPRTIIGIECPRIAVAARYLSVSGNSITIARGDKLVAEMKFMGAAPSSAAGTFYWGGDNTSQDSNIVSPQSITLAGDLNTSHSTARDNTTTNDYNIPINWNFDLNGATTCRNYNCGKTDSNIQFCKNASCTTWNDANNLTGGIRLPTGYGGDTNRSQSPHTSGTSYNVGWTFQGKTAGLYRLRINADANQSGDANTSNAAFDQNAVDVNANIGKITQIIGNPGSDGNTYAINTNFDSSVFVSCDKNGGCGNVDTNVQYCIDVGNSCALNGGPWFDINSSGGPIQLISGTMPDNNSNLSGVVRTYDANWVLIGTVANSYELRFNTYGDSITDVTSSATAYSISITAGGTDTTFALSLPSSGCTQGKGSIDAGTSCDKGYFEATDLTGTADENQVNPEGQTSSIPLFVYDNQSTSSNDLNIALDLNAALPATLRLKAAQASNRYGGDCSGFPDTNCVQITDNNESIGKATFTAGTQDLNVWLWGDFVAATGDSREDRNVLSTSYGSLACTNGNCIKNFGIFVLFIGIFLLLLIITKEHKLFFERKKTNAMGIRGNIAYQKYLITAMIAIIFLAEIFLI
ncbi:MAG: hypothetical protein Q7S21_01760 [archaeon]|nr:hypothetical protein [archaeon]